MTNEKRCSACYQNKLLSEYHKMKRGKDGKAAECKFCAHERRKLDRGIARDKVYNVK